MPRLTGFLCVLLLTLLAVPAAEAKIKRPIVYAVVVDGLDGDKVDAGKAPFVSSLLAGQDARATYYRESRSVMLAETNPNHTAMVTGAYGATSGIPGNAFALYQPLENEDGCNPTGPVDLTKKPTVTSGESAACLQAETVFAALERQGNPDGLLTAAIFGKPKLGRIFAGSTVRKDRRDVDFLWAPCDDSSPDDDSYCQAVPTNPVTGYAASDAPVMDTVLRTMRDGIDDGAGAKRRPDFTFVNLPQADTGGHSTGTGAIYEQTITDADTQLRRLVTELKARGEWSRTVLMLLSDHAMDTTFTKTSLDSALKAGGVSADDYLIVPNGGAALVYLADRTSPDRFALLKRMRAAALASPNVSEVLYREPNPEDGGTANTIDAVRPGWRLAGERTGDLVVLHKPGGAFGDGGNPLPGNHGASTTRDNFFAVTGGGPFVRQLDLGGGQAGGGFDDTDANPGQAENADVAATVMGLFGRQAPRDSAGRFLSEAFDLAAAPGRGAPGRVKIRARGVLARRARLSWSPRGGLYDLQVRRGKAFRSLQSASPRTSRLVRRPSSGRRTFRVRARSVSGVVGRWSYRKIRSHR